jgi:TolB-like protein/Tfp pilus assembly protein PilF
MTQKTNSFERFWQELKRRKVVHVITVYVAIAFGIIQLVDFIGPSLKWPDWTITFVIVLLCIGFIIAIFLSWIYDITPTGVKKTKTVSAIKHSDQATAPTSNGWKITSYISIVIIVALIALNFISKRNLNADISKLEKSIAVLPFINDSPSDSNQYFINGIMEEVLNNLQKIKDFRVLSRTSTDRYKGTDRPTIPEIAKKLAVSYILEGSGQKYGNSYRLRVQLIAGNKERHLWADSYEKEIRETKDIYSTQSEIAQSIASELKATITPEEKQLIEKIPTTSLTALDFFQKGRDEHTKYWVDNTKTKALDNAISYYKLALKIDSTFAQAYTGLAIARYNYYWQDVSMKLEFSESEMKIVRDSIISLVDKALNYNDKLEEAYLVMGGCSENQDKAIKEYRKALEINPNYSWAYNAISNVLFYGKNESIDGIKNLLKAIELERGPLLPGLLFELGYRYESLGFNENAIDIYNQLFQLTKDTLLYFKSMSGPYYAAENWEESIRWAKKILEKDPNNYWAHMQLAMIYSYIGKDDLFRYHTERIVELSFWPYEVAFNKGILQWERGDKLKANATFAKVIELSEKLIISDVNKDGNSYLLAQIFSLIGEQKKAMEYFNKISINLLRQDWMILEMEYNPLFQNIRSNERFQEILNTSKSNWQKEHEKVRIWLEENNLLKI